MKHTTNRPLTNALATLPAIALALLVAFSPPARALSRDTQQPIHIESDQQALDIQSNIVTFSGNVVLTQGSIKIRADQLIVTRTDGEKGREIIEGTGKPATFYQLQDNGKPIEAHALHMRYDVQKDLVTLSGDATLKQLDSSISGERISYLVKQQKMQAFSGETGRVTTVLLPAQLRDNPPPGASSPSPSQTEQ